MNEQTKTKWTEQDEAEWNAMFQYQYVPRKNSGNFSDSPIYFAMLILAIALNFTSIVMTFCGQ
jgi:hypothetical protein